MKIVTVLGAHPEFIKTAAFFRAIASFEKIKEIILPLHPRTVNKIREHNITISKNSGTCGVS